MGTRPNPRDENNWRVPKAGTTSFKIYSLLRQGKNVTEIAALLKKEHNTVYVLAHKIKNPDYHNKLAKVSHARSTSGSNQDR